MKRKDKLFNIRIICLCLGLIILYYVYHQGGDKEVDKTLDIEIASILLGMAIGAVVGDGVRLLVPCKDLRREYLEY